MKLWLKRVSGGQMIRVLGILLAVIPMVWSPAFGQVAEAARPPQPCAFPCYEDFDDGVFDHTILQFKHKYADDIDPLPNLWHVSSACADAPSPPNYYAFNIDSTCDYPEGVRSAGGVRLSVDLSNTSQAYLRFKEFLDVESTSSFDQPSVRASSNGEDWFTLMDRSYARPRGWRTVGLDLSPLAGNETVYIEWWFDTVDQLFNGTLGWLLDDVRIDAHPLCSSNDARSGACVIRAIPYGNHQSTAGFTTEPAEISGCGLSGSTAWFEYTHRGESAMVTVDTRGSNFDTVIGVFDGDVPVGCNDEHDEVSYVFGKRHSQAVLTFPAVGWRTYHIQIGGYQGATGSLLFEVRCAVCTIPNF